MLVLQFPANFVHRERCRLNDRFLAALVCRGSTTMTVIQQRRALLLY